MFGFLKRSKELEKIEKSPSKLAQGLKRTRSVFVDGIAQLFSTKRVVNQELLNEIEEKLLLADVGVDVTTSVISQLKSELKTKSEVALPEVLSILKAQLSDLLASCERPLIISKEAKPFVILLIGVNGSGKTTTIGKLAKKFQSDGYKIMLAAGDTFRAAAIEQLKVWGERNDVTVIAQKQGGDSSAVLYDALRAAKARGVDILLADTAGRLHTQNNLMTELQKVKRSLQKIDPLSPQETLLVLDATIGQNALNQAKQFSEAMGVSGICLTKLDGTAKGGIIFAIAKSTKIPIRFIGIGEGIDALKPFVAKEFVETLFFVEKERLE